MEGIAPGAIWQLADAIRGNLGKAKGGGGVAATVSHVDEEGTPWIQLGDAVVPAVATSGVSYSAGDSVYVETSDGVSTISGNISNPPVPIDVVEGMVGPVSLVANAAEAASSAAHALAAEAQAAAEATDQHFWHRSTDPDGDGAGTGAFVTDEEQDGFLTAMAQDVQPTTARPLHNLLMNAEGILLRAAKRIRAAFTASGVAFYDGLGNAAANVVARFGADGSQVGRDGAAHTTITDRAVSMVDANGGAYARMETTDPTTVRTFTFTGNGTTKAFTIASASQPTTDGKAPSCSVTVDGVPVTDGVKFRWTANYVSLLAVEVKVQGVTFDVAPASGAAIVLSVAWGHNRGFLFGVASNTASVTGDCAVGEGYLPTASASASHAEGVQCVAYGFAAHAEGHATLAEQPYSHAEGDGSKAMAESAHAEGRECMATEGDTHAQNTMTIAGSLSQTAMGRYNVADYADTYALIVGNGTSDSNRSNALTVDWSGNVGAAGDLNATKATFSGTLAVNGITTLRQRIDVLSSNLTRDVAPSANTQGAGRVDFRDSAGTYIGGPQPYFGTSGREGVRFGTSRTVSGSSVANWLHLYVDASGTPTVGVSSGLDAAWRNALGASSGVWPASVGGTGSDGYGTVLTNDISTSVSVPHSSWTSLGSVTLAAGVWIVSYNCYFTSNATGRRGMLIHTAADATSASSLRQGGVEVMAVSGGNTMLNGCRVLNLTSSATYYLNVMQTSGAALNATGYIRAFRLK